MKKLALIVAGLLLAVAAPVLAHHSSSEEFDINKPVTLKGVVTKIEWMNPDCSVLSELTGKMIILGVLDLSTHEVETPGTVAHRIRRAIPFVSPRKNRRGSRLRPKVSAPRCSLRKVAGLGCRRPPGAFGTF